MKRNSWWFIYKGGQWREKEGRECNDADHAGVWDPILLNPSPHTIDFLPFCFPVSLFLLFSPFSIFVFK